MDDADTQLALELMQAFGPFVAKYADPDKPHPLRAFDILLSINGKEHRLRLGELPR